MLARIPLGPAASLPRVEDAQTRLGGSAADRSALFVGFSGTIGGSDFSSSCIIGYDLIGLPDADRRQSAERPNERSPGSRARSVHACLGSMTTRDRS